MIGIKKILEQVVADTGVFPIDTSKRKPPYPYSTYNLFNIATKVTEQGILESDEDKTYQTIQPQLILSINSYSDVEIEAIEQSRKMYHYFRYHNDLEEINAVVVDIQDISNRTVLITDHYEYRYGFDVFIRYVDTIEKENYTVEDGSVSIEYD